MDPRSFGIEKFGSENVGRTVPSWRKGREWRKEARCFGVSISTESVSTEGRKRRIDCFFQNFWMPSPLGSEDGSPGSICFRWIRCDQVDHAVKSVPLWRNRKKWKVEWFEVEPLDFVQGTVRLFHAIHGIGLFTFSLHWPLHGFVQMVL